MRWLISVAVPLVLCSVSVSVLFTDVVFCHSNLSALGGLCSFFLFVCFWVSPDSKLQWLDMILFYTWVVRATKAKS